MAASNVQNDLNVVCNSNIEVNFKNYWTCLALRIRINCNFVQ